MAKAGDVPADDTPLDAGLLQQDRLETEPEGDDVFPAEEVSTAAQEDEVASREPGSEPVVAQEAAPEDAAADTGADDGMEGDEADDSEAPAVDPSDAYLSAASEVPSALTFDGGSVSIDGVTEGSATYDGQTATLTLDGITAGDIYAEHTIKVVLVGTNSCSRIRLGADSSLTIAGTGSLSLVSYISAFDFKLEGGTVSVTDSTFGVWASNSFAMRGGSLDIKGLGSGGTAIHSDGNVAISGGKITVYGQQDLGIDAGVATETEVVERPGSVTITGGTVSIGGPSSYSLGIRANAGNIKMTGGTVKVSASWRALDAFRAKYNGKYCGGVVSVTGGALTATVSNPSSNYAIRAGAKVVSKATCLKTVKGRMSVGASFKVAGNTYSVLVEDDYDRCVTLTSYGSTKTAATFSKVKYGGQTYAVTGVEAKAFSTGQGKKLKKIIFKQDLTTIGKLAFSNTSSLTSLSLKLNLTEVWKSGKVKGLKPYEGSCTVAKTAFKKCGKAGGKKLSVRVYGSPAGKGAYRTYLTKRGLSKKAKLTCKY